MEETRSEYLKKQKAARMIQAMWAGYIVRKQAAQELEAIVTLQSWWRKIISHKTFDTISQERSHSDSFKHYSDEDANHNGEVLGTFNQEKESRTTSVSINVFANDHSRSNSLEHFVPILESRHASLDESELIRVTESNSMMIRGPLETTPLKPSQNPIDEETDSDDVKDQHHADC